MTVFVALLRGVNVGGRSSLAMADLRAIAEGCGFTAVRTYVQSGTVAGAVLWQEVGHIWPRKGVRTWLRVGPAGP